jgi:hypothetical protein|tara:strand:+ start:895 stop:1023 length:129 start_codon:yes stop_codon:yes gene_type:complete
MESIEDLGKNLTILIIALRISNLSGCNQIIEISKDDHKYWNQ